MSSAVEPSLPIGPLSFRFLAAQIAPLIALIVVPLPAHRPPSYSAVGDVCLCDTNSYQRRRRKRHRSSVLVKRCKRTGTAVYWMRLPERQREAGYVLLSTSSGPLLSLFSAKLSPNVKQIFGGLYYCYNFTSFTFFLDILVPFLFGVWFLSCLYSINQFHEKMSSLGIVHLFHCVPRTNSEVNK